MTFRVSVRCFADSAIQITLFVIWNNSARFSRIEENKKKKNSMAMLNDIASRWSVVPSIASGNVLFEQAASYTWAARLWPPSRSPSFGYHVSLCWSDNFTSLARAILQTICHLRCSGGIIRHLKFLSCNYTWVTMNGSDSIIQIICTRKVSL